MRAIIKFLRRCWNFIQEDAESAPPYPLTQQEWDEEKTKLENDRMRALLQEAKDLTKQ